MKIGIIGAGAYGTALGSVLSESGHKIDYYDPKFQNSNLPDLVAWAEITFFVAPSACATEVLPYLDKKKPLVIASKGFLNDEIFSRFKNLTILSGPGYADDIKNHRATKLTVTNKKIADLFHVDYISFDYASDIRGVLMCGALKNIYAILAGYLALLPQTKSWISYIDSALSELKSILILNRADPATVDLACGKSDLMLTCSARSRNYIFGTKIKNIGKIQDDDITIEGISTLPHILNNEIHIPKSAKLIKQVITIYDRYITP